MQIDRAFVRLAEGEMLTRTGGTGEQTIMLFHAGPASGFSLEPLMAGLMGERRCIAVDTPGQGDSAPLGLEQPAISDYAEAMWRVADKLSLDRPVLYGTHTGAHIALEMALSAPGRVAALVLDGLMLIDSQQEREELLAEYGPAFVPEQSGSHLVRAWHFVRDQSLHFPWFKRVPENRLAWPMMPDGLIARITLDVLKAPTSYRLAYHAVFRHDAASRLRKVKVPTLVIEDQRDPLSTHAARAADLVPGARHAVFSPSENEARRAELIADFLAR